MLRRLLLRRFGALGPTYEAAISTASETALERYADRVLTASPLEEVLRDD